MNLINIYRNWDDKNWKRSEYANTFERIECHSNENGMGKFNENFSNKKNVWFGVKLMKEILIRIFNYRYRMSIGCSERLQLGSLVAAFNEIRHIHDWMNNILNL